METAHLIEALERGERDRRPVEADGLRFTSLERVLWPAEGLTKGDLIRYYVRVAGVMTRYLDGRPLMLKRYPNGVTGEPVVQQRPKGNAPAGVRIVEVADAAGEPRARYIGSRATLLYAAQLHAIELHPWQSTVSAPDRPDWVVLDLDPSRGAGFRKVVHVALALREALRAVGLEAGVKTSGSRGLHLYVPAGGRADYGLTADFARRIAERVASAEPAFATVERAIKSRGYRVYIDHLQNARGKTAVAAYSVRGRRGAPVSMPIRWEEVRGGLDPRGFRLPAVPDRLAREGDPWQGLFEQPGDLIRALDALGAGGRGT